MVRVGTRDQGTMVHVLAMVQDEQEMILLDHFHNSYAWPMVRMDQVEQEDQYGSLLST